ALAEAPEQLRTHEGVRAIVLSGEGKSFCSGLDVMSLMSSPDLMARAFEPAEGTQGNYVQHVAMGIGRLPVPVISAIHGRCYGGGLQIALGADMRVVAPDAELSVMEIRWGLVPDMGITVTLRDMMRKDTAKWLTMSGEIVNGEKAVALGLATRVDAAPVDCALEMAAIIASKSPDAIRGAKTLFDEAWHAPESAALAREAEIQQGLLGKPNQMEAVSAALQKRSPRFSEV
ncbi:MAG: crotonase/enoyl-CoA hydratase family protein, partial [Pseudomonadota bacterium]